VLSPSLTGSIAFSYSVLLVIVAGMHIVLDVFGVCLLDFGADGVGAAGDAFLVGGTACLFGIVLYAHTAHTYAYYYRVNYLINDDSRHNIRLN
jgi:hypothetical protein